MPEVRPPTTAPDVTNGAKRAVNDAADGAKRAASNAVENKWVARFLRFGYIARGMVYLVLGMLALRLSVGIRDEAVSQNGALAVIGKQPFGHTMLVAIAAGLASYALWGLIRSVADPNHECRGQGGRAKRLGFAASALGYGALTVITLQFIVGPRPHTATPYRWTASLLEKPFGEWLVTIIGLALMVVVALQSASTWRNFFEKNLDIEHRGRTERRWAKCLGRIGIATRGIVSTIIGVLMVASAFHANPHHLTGLDGALLGLARQPFGRTLLAATGLGFVAFGAFSILCARWMRIGKVEVQE